jgi:Protein of unknown function (DUF2970)
MGEGSRKATPWEALRVVLSAFIGVRRRDAHEKVRVTPLQIIVTAVIAAMLFVAGLITVVRLVTR